MYHKILFEILALLSIFLAAKKRLSLKYRISSVITYFKTAACLTKSFTGNREG